MTPLKVKYDRPLIAESYHQHRYGHLHGRLNLRFMKRALGRALVKVPVNCRVLDVPCGTGQYSRFLSALGFQVVAADISPEMLRLARGPESAVSGLGPEFRVEDIFHLSEGTRSFGAAVCIRFFNLVDRPERISALRELARVAEVVIVSYNQQYSLKHFSRLLRSMVGLRTPPRRKLRRAEVESEIRDAGLQVQEWIYVAPLLSEVRLAVLEKYVG